MGGVSKRVTLKMRYKIERKVSEHNRKQRRQSKKDQASGLTQRRALKKDPGIPNLWPFKEQLLRQIEAKKDRDEERKKLRAEDIRKRRAGPTEEDLAKAAQRAEEHAAMHPETVDGSSSSGRGNARHAASVLKTVVEESDIIIQVLDARDPMGSRSPEIEQLIGDKNKRMIFVLNKTDLIPESATKGWINTLRKEYPACPFAANTSKQKSHLKRAAGVDDLIKLLKSMNKGSKSTLVVGIVGVPNVGKSSLVNSLKMRRAVTASAQAGSTKSNQRVSIDSRLDLIDTPGVSSPYDPTKVSKAVAALRKCLEPIVEDPLAAVEALVRESGAERFMMEYGLARFSTPKEFLASLAQKTGRLSKGGLLDLEAAAKLVVNDCQKGKLKMYVNPPLRSVKPTSRDAVMDENDDDKEVAVITEEFAPEFEFANEDEAMGL